ncbi:uncharacterized protein LOC144703005 [Wolffia australiana]
MVTAELPEEDKPRSMPPPDFAASFASPSLRWACKKRLRCLQSDPSISGNTSPSPSPNRRSSRSRSRNRSPCEDDDDGDKIRIRSAEVGSRPIPLAGGRSLRSALPEMEKKKIGGRVELWLSLSRDEIEEDFLWMTGSKPPRRSRRRDKSAFDNLLLAVFPGSWLPNKISAARYRVQESDSRKIAVLENGS